jgi:hypothetical protein
MEQKIFLLLCRRFTLRLQNYTDTHSKRPVGMESIAKGLESLTKSCLICFSKKRK